VFEGQGEIKDYNGSYTEYRLDQEKQAKKEKKEAKQEALAAAEKPNSDKNAGQAPKTKRSFKEKYEFETLEKK